MLNTIVDKNTIGLTPEGKLIMAAVMDMGLFKEMSDVAKFAISLAINSGVKPSQAERAETVWNIGSFDADNRLQQLILILYPACDTPYRAVEHLIDLGLKQLKAKIDEGNFDIVELVAQQEANPA